MAGSDVAGYFLWLVSWDLGCYEILAQYDPRPPVRDDVAIPQVLIDAGYPDAELMTIDFVEIGRIRSDVIDKWQTDFASKK